MSIESIIGITSGLIGIISAIIASICWVKKKVKKCPASELFKMLMQKNISDSKRREILIKLNNSSLINKKIKEEYIQNFRLENRGQETVLFDIFDSNDIEPTDDICKGLIGVCMPSLRKRYQEKRQNKQEVSFSEPKQTNNISNVENVNPSKKEQTVYMSEMLKTRFPDTCNRLIGILEKHSVKYAFLKGTKDIWCRDYMPVQAESGKFIQFRYEPSYLKGNKEWEESRSDVEEVCRMNNIHAQISDINLDGGNVLICEGHAILSDRIFSENPERTERELIDELGKLLECEIIIIKALNSKDEDFTGHADGMVRFVNRNTILGNRLADDYKYIQDDRRKIIEKYNLKYIDVPFFTTDNRDSAIGIYVNYLEVNDLIVVPVFGRDEDKEAVDIIQKAFPNKVIETINYDEVALEGGLLNCTTWVIR
ncbi:MAG: agmatine deiminase family protein [Bacteroidales bacterium]|jgi:agmatine/peptidylarginine deiminase|nr:agmatine deiminase family protein [Bacteroidales bacterium]